MKKIYLLFFIVFFASCGRQGNQVNDRIITVSIAPFKYFVDVISGGDFRVNVMVPPGSDPHVYEPVPEQISKLRMSEGYISDGYLGFEMNWLDRLYQTNRRMKKLNLGNFIEPIKPEQTDEHSEGADPHYWVSPNCAKSMATAVKDFISELNPSGKEKYAQNCNDLLVSIDSLDMKAQNYFEGLKGKSFMIYHPNLAYLARDYGLKEVAVESEGKEPTPAGMKYLVDLSARENIKTIFVQREFDTRNAKAIASDTGARLVIIDPLSENWLSSTTFIIEALHKSLTE
jgi:zinc transport system substrate-binding protein